MRDILRIDKKNAMFYIFEDSILSNSIYKNYNCTKKYGQPQILQHTKNNKTNHKNIIIIQKLIHSKKI